MADETNGVAKPAEAKDAEAPAEETKQEATQERSRVKIDGSKFTIDIDLDSGKDSYTLAIGALELSKKLVDNYFAQKAFAEAQLKAARTILRPNGKAH
jgi:hypothetical protein